MSNTNLSDLNSALADFYRDRYVSATDLADFLATHHLPDQLDRSTRLRALMHFDFQKYLSLRTLDRYLYHREDLNQKFLRHASKQKYEIEGNKLDPDQIRAVVANEDAELVLAPAGSGKTATLLAKVDYLITHGHINPAHILLIAFTRKVVAELKDRISHEEVKICTFHSLGNQIIKDHREGHAILDDRDMTTLIRRIVQNLKSTSSDYKKSYDAYIRTGGLATATTSFIESHHTTDDLDLELLFLSILNLQKSKNYSLADLESCLPTITDHEERENATKLFQLYAPIYQRYIHYLDAHHFYDFSDMLTLATHIVRHLPPGSFPYRYILVDEAQDLSDSKCQLLEAVLEKCTKAKLFAVGDDWQSIYRFAGSNLDVLENFEKTFHRATFRTVINSTYRFGQPTARISNKFIEKNPRQSRKRVKPLAGKHTSISVRLNEPQNDGTPPDYHTLDRELTNLYREYGDALFHKKLQIVSRYNRDISRIIDEATHRYAHATYDAEKSTFIWTLPGAESPLLVPFCTMHRSKGITRDIVFVINLNDGHLGMPATRPDNPLTATMLSAPDAYPHAEERRLFYVAITRARERTILIADRRHISDFVFEISPRLTGAGVEICPHCHHGVLESRHTRRSGRLYYSCPHCHYIKS